MLVAFLGRAVLRHGETPASREAGPPDDAAHEPDLRSALAVADAVLVEGYLLYPYRRSSGKNRVRWQFGVLLPPAWADAHGLVDESVAGSAESWWQQTECLLEPGGAGRLRLRLRFLHVQRRTLARRLRAGDASRGVANVPVDELRVGGRVELAFDEAVPRDIDLDVALDDLLGQGFAVELGVPGGEDVEDVVADGSVAGRVVRRRLPLAVTVRLRAERAATASPLLRLRVRVENAGDAEADADRDEALRSAMIATHLLLKARPGRFLSLLDPPAWAAEAARACRNVHTFPVLAGEDRAPTSSCPRRSSSRTTRGSPRRAPATCTTPARSTRSSRCAR